MRILFSHYQHEDEVPAVRTIIAIAEQLRALGHEVEVHRSFGPSKPRPAGSRVGPDGRAPGLKPRIKGLFYFARATARNLPMYRRDVAALRRVRPDVVLVRSDAYCLSMALAARREGVPLVTYADAPVSYETRLYFRGPRRHPPGLLEAIERWSLARSRVITATSRPTMRKLEELGLRVPMRVVPNGLHPERFPELSDEDRRRGRAELGLEEPLILGFQGNFQGFHGIDRLRDIMLGLAPRRDVRWLLIGDGPERPALEAAVAGRVPATFLGRRPPAEVGRLLGLMDVAVAPHHFVPGIFYLSPLKIIEYAAAGCAVVAGAQGDIPWLLDDGRAGVVLDDESIPAWCGAIEALLDDAPRRRSLGRAARRHVLGRFTWRHIAELYESALRDAVGDVAGEAGAAAVPARDATAVG